MKKDPFLRRMREVSIPDKPHHASLFGSVVLPLICIYITTFIILLNNMHGIVIMT